MPLPVSLPRLNRAAIAERNRLARRHAPLQADVAGRPWAVTLQPRGPGCAPRDGLVDLPAEWGTAPVLLRVGPRTLGDLVQQALGAALPDDAPALLRRAMVEAALGTAMTQLERASGRRLHLVDAGSVATPATPPGALHGIDWQVEVDGLRSEGELWTDDAGLHQLAAHWAGSPSAAQEGSDGLDALPVVLRLGIGWVDLPASQLATLGEHDVLLLDETWLRPDGGIVLRVGRDSALIGRIDGTRIVITQAWTDIMADRMDDDGFDDEFDDEFDDDDEDDELDEDDDEDEDDDDDEDDEEDDEEGAPAALADDDHDDEQDDEDDAPPRRRLSGPAEPPAQAAPQRLQPSSAAAAAAAAPAFTAVAPVAVAEPPVPAARPAPATRRSVGQHVDALPVRLSFDLGQRTLTLAELRDIGPGHVFELGRELRRCVIVRANGRPIGEGELVDVDGRLGVSLVHLTRGA